MMKSHRDCSLTWWHAFFPQLLESKSLCLDRTVTGRFLIGNLRCLALGTTMFLGPVAVRATPANKAALVSHYDNFLSDSLARCTTCHLPSDRKNPQSLDEFPHNPFGRRLRILREEWSAAGKSSKLSSRLDWIASEDSDGDGTANETELLLGHNPGD